MGLKGGAMDETTAPQPGTIEDLETDLEQFAGEEIKDPWDDDSQTDWPNSAPVEIEEEA